MEPLALADAVCGALAAIGLFIALGGYGRRWASPALAIGLSLRLAVVVLRAAGVPALRRDLDADVFATGSLQIFERGRGIYESGGAQRFEWYLYALRRWGGLSVFGLELLGVVVWCVGAILLLEALRSIGGHPHRDRVLWLVAVLPSGLLWTSGLLREPYEFTAVALATYAAVRMTAQDGARRWAIVAAAAALGVGWLLHTALGLAAVGFVLAACWFEQLDRLRGRPRLLAVYVAAFVVVAVAGAAVAASHVDFTERRTLIADYSGSASYRTHLVQLGPLSLPVDTIVGYVLYVVSPLPWQLRGPSDLLALAEVVVRVTIMAAFVPGIRRSPQRRLVLLLAVAVQLGFSVGTLNWGTSMRHNYVSLAALTVAAGALYERGELWVRQIAGTGAAGATRDTVQDRTPRKVGIG